MIAVVDTNVLVSATLIRGGNEDKILRAWRAGAFDLAFSRATLGELSRVLTYEKLRKRRWLSDEQVVVLVDSLAELSILAPGELQVKASRDLDDDKFVAVAIESEADVVVTGDKDLLDINGFRGVSILRPAEFLARLRWEGTS